MAKAAGTGDRESTMIDSLFNTLLFCSHRRISFPMTIRKADTFASTPRRNRMLVSCLDCGKEFSYNWEEMRIDAAEPLVGFRAQRIAAFWFSSARAAFNNAAVDSYRFLSEQHPSTKLISAICSGIETMASIWYLQPPGFRTVLAAVQLRLHRRRGLKWPLIVKIEAGIQTANLSLKKIVNTAVHEASVLHAQQRLRRGAGNAELFFNGRPGTATIAAAARRNTKRR